MFNVFRISIWQRGALPSERLLSTLIRNEPILEYKNGSKERKDLKRTLDRMLKECPEIPIYIGKDSITTKEKQEQKLPHKHKQAIAKFHYASIDHINRAIITAMGAQERWRRVDIKQKYDIWQKAANLMSGKYRQELNASIMLGQAKTVIQAEIDTVELIDFLRFGADYLLHLAKFKPLSPTPNIACNTFHLRPLDGFIAAVTPFNFTAIGGNLAYTPTLLGNCTIWKPSDTAVFSNWIVYKIMLEAGVPPEVVNFLPSRPEVFGSTVTKSPHFAGLNFTGSVATFRKIWIMVSNNLDKYNCFPRLVGECGGKNYIFVHPTADVTSVVNAACLAGFEFSGQKCSALARLYVPESLWECIAEKLKTTMKELKLGDVCDFSAFTSAVIDEKAFDRVAGYIARAKKDCACQIVAGGGTNKTEGYFINPTVIETSEPCNTLMTEEIFGPLVTVYVYKDCDLLPTLKLINESTDFALTGSIFAKDKKFLVEATEILRMSAGNFYINDKCTGSVVAQQPFGGSRLSGTNDKAGSPQYLQRWASPQVVKETYVPIGYPIYPYMK